MSKKTKVTDYIVEKVERKVIQNFIHKHHYSHNTNGIQQMDCFALFREGRFGFDKETDCFEFKAGNLADL